MFSTSDRTTIRSRLVERAEGDPSVAGAALVGSAARDAEDVWSDIDLALQLAPGVDERVVVETWTDAVGRIGGGTADLLDVHADGVRYRVFFLTSSLQIDLSFWPFNRFRSSGEPFTLLFGRPAEPAVPAAVDTDRVIGMGWLYAIHARSAVARGRVWQASGMLDELRNQLIMLRCVRAGLEPWHGRGVDRLPAAALDDLRRSRPTTLTPGALDDSRRSLTASFLSEVERHDPARARRLSTPFRELVRPVTG